jgi:hypothetical protein
MPEGVLGVAGRAERLDQQPERIPAIVVILDDQHRPALETARVGRHG